jgi:hypothetical protein
MAILWRLVPASVTLPEAYGRTIALMGHNLDQVQAYDAAIIAF